MRESKAELTDRLRREGRWESFKKRRETLKAEGVPAKEAWWQVAAEFPAPANQRTARNTAKADLRPLKGKPAVSVAVAAVWVGEHLDTDWVTPADAPSPGAWSLLEWARSSMAARTELYKTFLAKIVMPPQEVARKSREERAAEERERTRRLFGHLEPPDPEADRVSQDAIELLFGRYAEDTDAPENAT